MSKNFAYMSLRSVLWLALGALVIAGAAARRDKARIVPEETGLEAAVPRRRIDSVRTEWGLTGRTVLACPAGDCIVLHYPPRLPEPHELSRMLEQLRMVVEADPATDEDNGEFRFDETSPWASLDYTQCTYNCCSFVVGDVAGLTVRDWIATGPSDDTDGTVPMWILLDSYFQRIRVYEKPAADWRSIHEDASLKQDDVLCYVKTGGPAPEVIHAGKIWRNNGVNWLVSKMGAGPIARATIQSTGALFSGGFDEIYVYRRRPAKI